MRIYICGNPLVEEDSLPVKLLPELRKNYPEMNFVEFDPSEDLPHEKELIIIDTIINISDVMVLNDIEAFAGTKACSLHDFDLGTNLKLAKKMGWVKKITIIGVPPSMKEKDAAEKMGTVLHSLSNECISTPTSVSKSAQHSSCKGHTRG